MRHHFYLITKRIRCRKPCQFLSATAAGTPKGPQGQKAFDVAKYDLLVKSESDPSHEARCDPDFAKLQQVCGL
jgi:hypothetical protein